MRVMICIEHAAAVLCVEPCEADCIAWDMVEEGFGITHLDNDNTIIVWSDLGDSPYA